MTKIRDIRTQDGWMEALAKAISEQDAKAIEQLRALSTEWLQPEPARMAQYSLLDAAADLIGSTESSKPVKLAFGVMAAIRAAKDLIFAASVEIMENGSVQCGTAHSRGLINASELLGRLMPPDPSPGWPWIPVSAATKDLVKGKLCITSFKPALEGRIPLRRMYKVGDGIEGAGFREADFVMLIEPPVKDAQS